MKLKSASLLSVLLPIVCGCASQSQPACAPLPAAPKPQVPSLLMTPERPNTSSYQSRLSSIFETSSETQTSKRNASEKK